MNYEAGESEMLTVVEAYKQWRHYLEGAVYQVQVTTKTLNRKEVRWWERLSGLDLFIEYRPEAKNPVDDSSRRPDYESEKERRVIEEVTTSD